MADRDRGERILAVAGGLFVAGGVAGTTIRQIAREMKMSSGTIYYYYPSKESIASAILHRFLDELIDAYEALETSLEGTAADACLVELLRTSLEVASRHPHATEIYGNEISALSVLPDPQEIMGKSEQAQVYWQRILARGLDGGVFRSDMDVDHARLVMSHLTWSTVRWNRPQLVADHQRLADELASVLLGGFLSS